MFLVALTLLQIVMRIACSPTYVISSYSNVRLQQPTMSELSVESQMPMDIMLNPTLDDDTPTTLIDKMESSFMAATDAPATVDDDDDGKIMTVNINANTGNNNKSDDDLKTMDDKTDESEMITESINKQQYNNDDDNNNTNNNNSNSSNDSDSNPLNDSDLIALGNLEPSGFSLA